MTSRAWGLLALCLTACASGGTIGDAGTGPGPTDGAIDATADAGPGERCLGVDCAHLDDVCTVGACDPATGACAPTPRADGTACDDGDACTMDDACAAGTCAGAPLDCSAMDAPS